MFIALATEDIVRVENCARGIRTREEAARVFGRTNFTQVTVPDQLVPIIPMLLH